MCARAGLRVVQHEVALAERAALDVLAGEPDRHALLEQRGESQRLGLGPLDRVLVERRAPLVELRLQLAVQVEALRQLEQLLVERAQHVLRHGRARLGAGGTVELVLPGLGPGSREGGLEVRVRVRQLLVGVARHLLGVLLRDHALGDQPVRVQLPHRRMVLDLRVHERLGVGRLVGLVVAEAAVADQVDQRVAPEALAEAHRQPHGGDAGLHVVAVHVDDRDVEALCEVGGVAGRAALLGVGGEPELVVGDDVDRSARVVAVERLQVERLRHHALRREGGVAVDQHRQHHGGVVMGLAVLARGLVRAGAALHHRVHDLEVARVGRQRHGDRLAARQLVGARGAVVVLHVAGAALGHRGIGIEVLLALELHQDRLVGAADRVREHVQPAAVRHAEHHLAGACTRGAVHHLVEHRHDHVQALDRELLLPEEGLVQVALERLHLGQPLEQSALVLAPRAARGARPTRSRAAARRAGGGLRCARSRRRSCRCRSPADAAGRPRSVSPGTATRSTLAGIARISSGVRRTVAGSSAGSPTGSEPSGSSRAARWPCMR